MRASLLLFATLLIAPAFPQYDTRLDSIAWERMASWMKPNGRNKRHNFQFHFRYGEHYRFDGALGRVSKRDKASPAGHRYKTASVAKTFVAVLVLQLVEEGRVALDSAVVHYLPDELVRPLVRVKGKDLGHTITVRQLLTRFGSIQGIREAVPEDVVAVVGAKKAEVVLKGLASA